MSKKPAKKSAKKTPEGPPDFDQRVIMFLNVLLRTVKEQRARTSGAIKFGRDGMHVLLVEAADTAQKVGPNGYLSAATYALIAAMISAGQWDEPVVEEGKKGKTEAKTPEPSKDQPKK